MGKMGLVSVPPKHDAAQDFKWTQMTQVELLRRRQQDNGSFPVFLRVAITNNAQQKSDFNLYGRYGVGRAPISLHYFVKLTKLHSECEDYREPIQTQMVSLF